MNKLKLLILLYINSKENKLQVQFKTMMIE